MAIYDGFVSLGEDDVHVILGVEDDRVTLSASGAEIGDWDADEVSIRYRGEGMYSITAENETLDFVPNDQDLFAIRFGEISDDQPTSPSSGSGRHARAAGVNPEADTGEAAALEEAPPPGPVTKFAFYALAGVTVFLGLWAIASMILN